MTLDELLEQFDEVLDKVRAGNSLSESLALVDGFEQSMSSSIAVGEETGKLDSLLAGRVRRIQAAGNTAGAYHDRHHGRHRGVRGDCRHPAHLPVLRHDRAVEFDVLMLCFH